MGFIVINEPFVCKNCGEHNPPAEKTCRNHCKKCLYSLHVDKEFPGDRLSTCKGLMKPDKILGDIDNLNIFHKCIKCGKSIQNKTATDDDFELITKIMRDLTN